MNGNQIFAYVTKGKHKGKFGLIKEGPLNESNLSYPKSWYEIANEKLMAKKLIQSMFDSNLHEVVPLYINLSDTTYLISKYMAELGVKEFQGGCCG